MKTSSKKSKKNLLALALSFLMVASGASAFAACDKGTGNNDNSSLENTDKPSTSVNSDLKIANGDFETFNTNDGKTVIGENTTAAPNWSRTTTAPSSLASQAVSGIVNVSEWDQLVKSTHDVASLTVDQAKELFESDALTVREKLEYYAAWKKANPNKTIATELKDFYESFNISAKDLPMDIDGKPLENPLTHDYSVDENGNKNFGKGTNVLMIHNQRPEVTYGEKVEKSIGTAQKYSSQTTVTVQAGTAATFSVWVKTMDLHIANTDGYLQDAVDVGAYISVAHSVGSKALPALTIKNINTEGVEDNNGWKQYTFTLRGSAYANTTFSITLGLGMGNNNRTEYVNGYAFFDDIECQTISYEKYNKLVTDNATKPDATVTFTDGEKAKTFDVENKMVDDAANGIEALDNFSIDLYYGLTAAGILDGIGDDDTKATSTKYGNSNVTSEKNNNVYKPLGEGFDSTNDITKVFANVSAIEEAANSNPYLQAVYESYFLNDDGKVYDFTGANDKILMLLSTDGVAYTLDTDYQFTFKDANGNPTDYLAVSFFVKTSDMTGFTGAGVTLKDGYNNPATDPKFSSINTATISPVKVDMNSDGKADEDVHDGWQQYFFFVENNYEDKTQGQFSLSFQFGPTDIVNTTTSSYHEGFAAFTKFEVYAMSKAEYEAVTAGTYAQVVSAVGNKEEKPAGNNGFDTAAKVPTDALDKGFALPVNYDGMFNDNQLVNQNGTHDTRNNYNYAGLLNRESFTKYFSAPTGAAELLVSKLTANTPNPNNVALTAEMVWTAMFGYDEGGSRTQPLFILNTAEGGNDKNSDGFVDLPYGFIGDKVTVSANGYKKVSLAVKVGAFNGAANTDAVANIYLIDMDSENKASTLSIGRNLIYWYDDNGNICTDEDCENIAFKLEDNGLYTINKDWNEYKKLVKDNPTEAAKYEGYFANLNAYEKEEGTNNLLVAKDGASHDYNSYWKNQGLDGIAFYYSNGKYYAEKDNNGNLSVEVKNLFDVTKTDTNTTALLEARYLAEGNRQLMYTVENTNGKWVNVSFYIHAGETAKNYRLEVWSGARDGEKGNPVDTYVAFDTNYADDASTQFPALITEYTNDKTTFKGYAEFDAFENVFSWYDSDAYLRYNKNLDENGYGNLYAEKYTYSANKSGVAYLKYKKDGEVRILADYSFEDKVVTPASLDENKEDTSTPEEESTATGNETNFFMLFSSIAIAAVLVFVIVAVAVRKILKKLGKLPKKPVSKSKKEKPAKAEKTEKPEAPKAKAEPEDESPYND